MAGAELIWMRRRGVSQQKRSLAWLRLKQTLLIPGKGQFR